MSGRRVESVQAVDLDAAQLDSACAGAKYRESRTTKKECHRGSALVRTGASVSAYYLTDEGWASLLTAPAQTGDAYIVLFAWSNDSRFQHQEVQATFSDFRLAQGQLICP